MTTYRHTQIGRLMVLLTVVVAGLFLWAHLQARLEPPSVDSGANLAVTGVMVLIIALLASFSTLTVAVDQDTLRLRFGWGLFRKQLLLADIVSMEAVKNRWYHGWGIHFWMRPKMWIYNVSGFDAVQVTLRNGSIYRIGTDEPVELERALRAARERA